MKIIIFILTLLIIKIDLKKLYIPNILNFLFLVIAILYKKNDIENSIIGAGLYSLPLIILYGYISDFLGKEVIGFGDIKFMIGAGYLLGYTNFYELYIFYLIAFLTGGIYGGYILIKNKRKNIEMPFSPFLIFSLYFMMWTRL